MWCAPSSMEYAIPKCIKYLIFVSLKIHLIANSSRVKIKKYLKFNNYLGLHVCHKFNILFFSPFIVGSYSNSNYSSHLLVHVCRHHFMEAAQLSKGRNGWQRSGLEIKNKRTKHRWVLICHSTIIIVMPFLKLMIRFNTKYEQ